jgi:diadenosine tetraphosphate (Ap4A) HIT family hydrolase
MEPCPVCAATGNPKSWQDIAVAQDSLILLAHVPPSSASAADGYPGHLLLVPVRHVESPAAVTDAEAERLGLWLARGSRLLETVLGAEHVYLARLGDGWRHLHYHLIARYAGTPEEYRGLNVREWAGVGRCSRAEVAEIAGRLRSALE